MGYELDRLMKMYGVGSPSMPSYTGASKPTDFTDPNYAAKLANYEGDKAAYDKFQQDYQGRIAGVSPYSMAQFQMGPPPANPPAAPELLKNPVYTNNPEYYKPSVEQAYTTNLNRPFDVAGRDYWASQLAQGKIMPGGLQQAMLDAQKAGTNTTGTSTPVTNNAAGITAPQVEALYKNVFNRQADAPGVQYWLNSGLSLPQIEAALRSSPEATNAGYIDPYAGVSTDYYSNGGAVRRFAQGGLNNIQQSRGGSPAPGAMGMMNQPGIGNNANRPTNLAPANRLPQNKINPKGPLPGGNPPPQQPLVGANPLNPPVTGGPLQQFNQQDQQEQQGYGDDMLYVPQTGGELPTYQQPQTGGNLPTYQQPQTASMPPAYQPQNAYNVVAPAAYAKGGTVKMYRGGDYTKSAERMIPEEGLLSLADIYGLSNPGDLPMIDAPVQLAAIPVASDAEGFPVGSTADIVARGRAAVAQAQSNARAGVQPDPAVYDDAAAARDGASASVPAVAPRSAPAVSRPSIDELLKKYGAGSGSQYADQIRAAAEKSRAETEAFREMLKKQMTGENEGGPSKAEMYFRLAAALASPTKTGGVMENVGLAAKELGDYQKDVTAARRNARARNLELMLKGQELGMKTAKDELDTLRALGAEEGRDRRQIIGEVIKDYIRSGEPESAAGKQAKDEGLTPGTPEYLARVKELGQQNVDARLAQVTATLEGMRRQDDAAKLAREKFEAAQKKAAEDAAKLTPKEVDMKRETEDTVAQLDQSIENLKQAYSLNPNTFDSSLIDRAKRKVLEETMGDDPKVVATRRLENLLSRGAVEKLRASFGGNPTEGERKILLDLEGIGAKSRTERAEIMLSAYEALKARREREAKRLEDIKSGAYRERAPEKKEGEE